MKGILNRHHKMGILLLCVITLGLLVHFGGASGTLTASDGASYEIAVTYGAAARIPAGALLEVSELSGARYEGYYERAVAELGRFESMRAFDIRCLAPDGTEIEPMAPVKVAFRLPGNGHTRILHFLEGGGVIAPSLKRGVDALDFETDSFSVYAVVGTMPEPIYQGIGVPLEIMDERFVDFTADIFPAYLLTGEEPEATENEAAIGDTPYPTLSAALTKAVDGDTITLLKDVTGTFSTGMRLTLDLGGYTFTVDAEKGVQSNNGGALTITNGTITSNEDDIIYATGGGHISLESGLTVTSFSSVICADNNASVVVNGADVSTSANSVAASVTGGASIEVNSGTLSTSGQYALQVENGANATISGGTIHGVSVQAGSATITGGLFTSSVSVAEGGTGTLTVSGGVFQQGIDDSYVSGTTFTDENGYIHVGNGLTITADSDTKVYNGIALTVSTYTHSGLREGDRIESITVTGNQTEVGTSDNVPSGAVIKNASGEDVTGDYTITYVNGTLEVTPKAVTVTAENKSKTYGEADPELTAIVDGLLSGDSVEYTFSRETGEDVGTHAITPSGEALQGNYTVTYVPGTLTINRAEVTVTADNKTKVHGEADPELTATVTGLQNGDTASVISYTLSRVTDENSENVGTHTITVSGEVVQGNYDVIYETGTLTITNPTPVEHIAVTVKADDIQKTYGNADALTATVTMFVDGEPTELLEGVTIAYSLSREPGENVGTYTITPQGDPVQGDYDVTYETGTLTINPAAVTVTADNKTKVHGAADPELTAIVTGLQNGDTANVISYTLSREKANEDEGQNIGTYTITASGEAVQGNYNVTYVPGTLTIDRIPVTVTAVNNSKTYGETDPTFTATVTGLPEGVSESVISYTLSRETGEDVGTYTITPSGETTQGNYTVTYETGTLTINPAAVTVTADNKTKVHGAADPELTATVTGLQNGDTANVISYTLSREKANEDEGQNIGTYTITASGEAVQGNYNVTYVPGTLTIDRIPVTVTAVNNSKTYGETDPTFTATVTGLPEGVSESVISYTLSRETGEDVGTYTITASGAAEQGNYTVSYAPGTFTITKATAKVTAENKSKTYGAADPELTATVTMLVDGEPRELPEGVTITYDFSRDPGENVGTYTITPSGAVIKNNAGDDVTGNYAITYVNGTLEVTPKAVTVKADNKTKVYGDTDPELTANVTGLVGSDTISYELTREAGENVGTYTITAAPKEEAEPDNYTVTYENGTFTITKATATVTAENKSKTYGDTDPDLTAIVTGLKNGDAESVISYTLSRETGEDVGEYTITSAGGAEQRNYNVVFAPGVFTITTRAVTVKVTGNNASVVYDGTEHSIDGYDVVTISDTLYNDTYFQLDGTAEAKRTDVGTTDMGLKFVNNNNNFDVTFDITDGWQEITPLGVIVTIVGNHNETEIPYDGQSHTVSGYTASADSGLYNVENDFTFDGTAEATRTNAGTTFMELKPEQFHNNNDNFTVTFVVSPDGEVTITRIEATVEIIGHNNTTDYDGTEHAVSGYDVQRVTISGYDAQQVGEDSLYKAEYVTLNGSAEARRTDAGTTYMGLTEANFSNNSDNFSNVTFVVTDGYQTITPIDTTVTITGHTGTFAYDGTEHVVSGYDVVCNSALYTEDDFNFIGRDVATRTEAGTTDMNLSSEFFRNTNRNFETVTFDVTDGWITVNPSVLVSKTLDDELATTPETFTFRVTLVDDNNASIHDYLLAEGITTDADGNATFTLAVRGGETQDQRLSVPLGASVTVTEDLAGNPNHYTTWISVDGDEYEDVTALLYSVSESQTNIVFTNVRGNICRIEGTEFQTISSAVECASRDYDGTAVIEMLTDYSMSAADNVVIPSRCHITLSTAPEYEGALGIATITRAPGHNGVMFTNNGTLNLGGEELDSRIVLDGNGGNVTATNDMISNSGTLNIANGAAIQNANSSGNGGAIQSSGTVNISGGMLSGNHAASGGGIYATDGTVNISGGTMTGNTADNGGAISATAGTVNISGGTMTGNTADNGGAIYAQGATVHVTGGVLAGNRATQYGGAIYGTSGINVSGGVIGGTGDDTANRAVNGAAIFVQSGIAGFSGGEIKGNVATNGGAVGIGTVSVTLNFSGSPKIINNTLSQTVGEETTTSPANVCLSEDSAHIINANGLNNAKIGVYVPGDGDLYRNRGVSQSQFGSYTSTDGVNAFSNDRTPGMKVESKNSWLVWGKALKVETRYLANFDPANLPPRPQGTVRTVDKYYPANIENFVSDIAADSLIASKVPETTDNGAAFACAFASVTNNTTYAQCLSKVNWDSTTGNWQALRRDGTTVDNVTTLIIYYSLPAYLLIANNTDYPLDISSLTLNGINAADNGYGFVVARNGSTVEHFEPLKDSDLRLAKEKNVKLMFPGVRNKAYTLNGAFSGFEVSASVDYTYDTATNGTTRDRQSATLDNTAMSGFTITGNTFNSTSTIEVVFGKATTICKIVELYPGGGVKEEHFYSSLQNAVEDGDAYYDDYKVEVTDDNGTTYHTVKIEMLQDYLIPATDTPDIPSGRNFTFTTARQGETLGNRFYNGDRAVINQDQGNLNSFITAKIGGAGTALIIENLNFEGKQLSNVKGNGGVANTKDCAVTVRNANFSNFTAQNGGAIYADFSTNLSTGSQTLTVSNATFTSCISLSDTDRFGGGAIWTNAEIFTLNNGTFTSCTATQQGGAVFHRIDKDYGYRNTSKTFVSDCTFAHCNGAAAGALEINGYDITVKNCTFDDCQAKKRNGGGFNAFLQETNSNTVMTIEGCTFTNCFAQQNGGAFRTMYKDTTVKDCVFTENTANADGGGVAHTAGSELTLDHCTVIGNKSGGKGGGVYCSGNVTLCNDTTITGNSLTTGGKIGNTITNGAEKGAGVYIPNGKTLTVGPNSDPEKPDTIIVRENTAMDGSPSNLRLSVTDDGTANRTGCVIIRSHLSAACELRVLNANKLGTQFGITNGVTFPEGVSAFQADNNDLYGGIDRSDTSGTKIIWRGQPICKITDGSGNLLFFDGNSTDPAVFDHLDNGTANPNGNGAFSILKNTRDNLKLYCNGELYSGDMFCVKMLIPEYTANAYIGTNSANTWQTITFTTAGKDDADKFPYRGEAGTYATIIRGSGIPTGNSLLTGTVTLTLENIILDGDSSKGVTATVDGCLLQVNDNGNVTLGQNATLQNAATTKRGGAVVITAGDFTINGGIVQNCRANEGGGVQMNSTNGKFLFIEGEVRNCTATQWGGGIRLYQGTLEMSGGSVTGNSAGDSGGGVSLKATTMTMSGGSITGNSADKVGGGISVGDNQAKLKFSGDAVVCNNTKGGAACNVELNKNTASIINAVGLGDNALIGVYVPDTDNLYNLRGVEGKTFGTYTNDSNLFLFVNDRNGLRGWHRGTDEVYWTKMQSLTVSKTVSSDLLTDRGVYFNFKVTLTDTSINGKLGSGRTAMDFTNGVATFRLKHGESKVALYIPRESGAGNLTGGYTVEETENSGFTTTPGLTVTDTFDKTDNDGNPVSAHTVAFTNTRKTGNLTVTKTVESDDSEDFGKEFSFTVLLVSNDNISGTYGGMTFTNNKATFTLHNGGTQKAEGLPTGIQYTVTESYNPNFTTKVNDIESLSVSNVELQPGDENRVEFTNKRKRGGLIVKKTVSSDAAADKEIPFNFTVTLSDKSTHTYGEGDTAMKFIKGEATFSLKDGEYKEAIGLPYGVTYTVTEDAVPGFINTRRTNNIGRITDNVITSTFINTRNKGNLVIQKTLESDRYADRDIEFTFHVKLGYRNGDTLVVDTGICNKTYDTNTYNKVTFDEHGEADVTFKVTNNSKIQPFTIKNLPQGIDYEVTERETMHFKTTPEGRIVNGKIPVGSNTTSSTAAFTNTRETGSLKISKTVVNPLDGDNETLFKFKVQLVSNNITKTFTAVRTSGEGEGATVDNISLTFINGRVDNVELKHGQSITISGLPTDVQYIVTETPNNNFITTSTGESGTIKTDESEAKFTNTRRTNVLIVSKTVDNYTEALDKDVSFNFTVELTGGTVQDGTYGGMTFTNNVATFTLTNGQSVTATDLPDGIRYTVTETPHNDFDITRSQGASGTISKSSASTATFTNTRKSGKLIITKNVQSPVLEDGTKDYVFKIELGKLNGDSFELDESINAKYSGSDVQFRSGVAENVRIPGGTSKTISIPCGLAYRVSEATVTNMTTTIKDANDTEVNDYAVGVISKDAPSHVTFTNTRELGSLTVNKEVVSRLDADKTKNFAFTVTLTGGTVSGTFGDTVDGTFEGMTFTDSVATFELKDGEHKTAKGLPAGIGYTVTETEISNFTTTKTGDTGTIDSGTESKAKFINMRGEGNLTVMKTVDSRLTADQNIEFDFTVTLNDKTVQGTYGEMTFTNGQTEFKLKDGGSVTAMNLPKGVGYTVTETENSDFTTSKTGETGTIGTENSVAAFTNTRKTGDLTVNKTVDRPLTADKDILFDFTVTLDDTTINNTYGGMTFENGIAHFQLKHGGSVTAKDLPIGIGYTVTEANDDRFTPDSTDETGTISETKSEAKFTNTRKTNVLTISKTVVSPVDADKDEYFTFTVTLGDNTVDTFRLKDGESKTLTDLTEGATYTVTEANDDRFTSDSIKTCTIGRDFEAAFTNTRKLGSLKVSKQVIGALPAEQNTEFSFTVTLTGDTVNGTFEDMTFTNSVATFTLTNGQSVRATGLPVGVTYTVTETPNNKFTPDSAEKTGEISETESEAAFINTRKTTGTLTVSKKVESPVEADQDTWFDFKVTLKNAPITGKYGDMEFTNGIANDIRLHPIEKPSVKAEGLPIGIEYTVREIIINDPRFLPTENSSNISENSKAAVTNKRQTGSLTVIKTVESPVENDKTKDFTFKVTLTGGILKDGTYGDMTFHNNVSDEFQLRNNTSKTATGLPEGFGYTVEETGEYENFTTTISGKQSGEITTAETTVKFTNKRKTGSLTVIKTVPGEETDEAFTFKVTLTGNNGEKVQNKINGVTFTDNATTFQLKHGESKTLKGLPTEFTYTVTETDTKGLTPTIIEGNQSDKITIGETTVKFQNTSGIDVGFTKVDGSGNAIENVAEAEFQLSEDKDFHDETHRLATHVGANFSFLTVPPGVYYMKETNPPNGFEQSSNTYIVLVGADAWQDEKVARLIPYSVARPEGEVAIFLLNSDGTEIQILRDDAGNAVLKDGNVQPIPDINQSGKIMNIFADTNTEKQSPVILRKIGKDADGNPIPLDNDVLAQIKFDILYWDKTVVKYDDDLKRAENLTPASNGVFWVGHLPYGTYYLHEKNVPGNYVKLLGTTENWFEFEVNENGASTPRRLNEKEVADKHLPTTPTEP